MTNPAYTLDSSSRNRRHVRAKRPFSLSRKCYVRATCYVSFVLRHFHFKWRATSLFSRCVVRPNHLDDQVDSDQEGFNNDPSF